MSAALRTRRVALQLKRLERPGAFHAERRLLAFAHAGAFGDDFERFEVFWIEEGDGFEGHVLQYAAGVDPDARARTLRSSVSGVTAETDVFRPGFLLQAWAAVFRAPTARASAAASSRDWNGFFRISRTPAASARSVIIGPM